MMQIVTALLLLSFYSYQAGACPPVDLPQHATMNCSWTGPGVKQCRFECEWSAEMTGQSVITCQRGADHWDRPVPICSLDPTKCKGKGKKACLAPDARLLEKFEAHREFLTTEEKQAIHTIQSAYRGRKLSRSGSSKCHPWMCSVKCFYLGKNQRLVKRCNNCKNRKIIRCRKTGGPFR